MTSLSLSDQSAPPPSLILLGLLTVMRRYLESRLHRKAKKHAGRPSSSLPSSPSGDVMPGSQSPAQAMLRLVDILLENRRLPTHSDLNALRRMLIEEEDLRKPLALQQKLLADENYEDEVRYGRCHEECTLQAFNI